MPDALSIVAALESQSKALSGLGLHSQRLSRRSRERSELDDLLEITEMYEAKGETYDPSRDGFVFSEAQIAAAIPSRNRQRLLEAALRISRRTKTGAIL